MTARTASPRGRLCRDVATSCRRRTSSGRRAREPGARRSSLCADRRRRFARRSSTRARDRTSWFSETRSSMVASWLTPTSSEVAAEGAVLKGGEQPVEHLERGGLRCSYFIDPLNTLHKFLLQGDRWHGNLKCVTVQLVWWGVWLGECR